MNRTQFETFQRYRERKYERDLDALQQDFANKGLTFSSVRDGVEKRLKADYEDEVVMEREKMLDEVTESDDRKKERETASKTSWIMAGAAVLGSLLTAIFSFMNIYYAREANRINERQSKVEYDNLQPFLAVIGGNEDASSVRIKNVGGGPAKNIYFLKQFTLPDGKQLFALTKEQDIGLVLASGAEGNFNLNASAMDQYKNVNEVTGRIGCIKNIAATEQRLWLMAFYENLRGERFASKFRGTGTGYISGTEFQSVLPCGE